MGSWSYKVLVQKRPLWRCSCVWEDNIKIDCRTIRMGRCGVD